MTRSGETLRIVGLSGCYYPGMNGFLVDWQVDNG